MAEVNPGHRVSLCEGESGGGGGYSGVGGAFLPTKHAL